MNLQELKQKNPADLISEAEKLGIENPSTLRKQEILFAILKKLAEKNEQISASGVLEVLQDGFGFLRAIESNYLLQKKRSRTSNRTINPSLAIKQPRFGSWTPKCTATCPRRNPSPRSSKEASRCIKCFVSSPSV